MGDTWQLFDWTGVSPSGAFAGVVSDLPAGYAWNTSALYTLGDVTLTAVPEPSPLMLLAVSAVGLLGYAALHPNRTPHFANDLEAS